MNAYLCAGLYHADGDVDCQISLVVVIQAAQTEYLRATNRIKGSVNRRRLLGSAHP